MRKQAESAGSGEPLGGLEKDVLPRLYHDLRSRRVQLRLEQSEAETLLARRKKAEGATTDPARQEIAKLEDRLAVLIAGQKIVMKSWSDSPRKCAERSVASWTWPRKRKQIAQMEDASRKVAAEVEALSVELQAPPRVRTIDDAVAPRP